MSDKAKKLLERALELSDYIVGQEKLAEEIRAYLAEPVGNLDKFVRLTEVEVIALMNRDIHGYSLICAVENQLAEKNNSDA